MTYIASNHYWFVGGDLTQVFSSATNTLVPLTDPSVGPWFLAGNVPTSIDTMDNLKQVLHDADVPPYAPITMWQARKALRQAGLIDQVNAAVAAATPDLQDAWEYASSLSRTDPLVLALSTQLNLAPGVVDSLFTLAYHL